MIILDTNVVSEPLRSRPDPAVVFWLDTQALGTLYLTTLTVAEIRYGVAALPVGRRRRRLSDRVENEVFPLFEGRVLSFDEPATRSCAEVRSTARTRGRAIGDLDALIAAVAATHGFAVASRDTSPFEAAGVSAINPFTA